MKAMSGRVQGARRMLSVRTQSTNLQADYDGESGPLPAAHRNAAPRGDLRAALAKTSIFDTGTPQVDPPPPHPTPPRGPLLLQTTVYVARVAWYCVHVELTDCSVFT